MRIDPSYFDPKAVWYARAEYHPVKDYIVFIPAKKDRNRSKDDYCKDVWYRTKEDAQIACDKLNAKTKIGKSGMKVANRKCYKKVTVRELRSFLESLKNQDQEVVIYPKYTGADADTCSKYRFIASEMEDQWHQNYPYIALMF